MDTGKINNTGSLLAAGGLSLLLFIYYLLSKNKLIIDNEGITQEFFFGRRKEIRWDEIKSSNLNWHYHGHGASLEWVTIAFSGKTINLQISYYSRSNIRLIAEGLIEKCPQASIDKRIRNIAMGKFPWYIF